ncbi:hypothetical protein JHK82_040073 [Glycine max]|nr:hypothetical protein JHK82_040073 [Glycine max]
MSRSSSKVVKIDTPYDDECNDEGLEKEDQFAFMSRKNKKVLISTWEELNNTSSNEEIEEEEEANLCLMVDTTLKGSDEEENINNIETLPLAYHELFSNSPIL